VRGRQPPQLRHLSAGPVPHQRPCSPALHAISVAMAARDRVQHTAPQARTQSVKNMQGGGACCSTVGRLGRQAAGGAPSSISRHSRAACCRSRFGRSSLALASSSTWVWSRVRVCRQERTKRSSTTGGYRGSCLKGPQRTTSNGLESSHRRWHGLLPCCQPGQVHIMRTPTSEAPQVSAAGARLPCTPGTQNRRAPWPRAGRPCRPRRPWRGPPGAPRCARRTG